MASTLKKFVKKHVNKTRENIDHYLQSRITTQKFPEGGCLTQYGFYNVADESAKLIDTESQSQVNVLDSNIKSIAVISLRSRCRDMYYEEKLQSGQYQFPDMFMVVNPYGEAPLTALVLFETEKECQVRVTVKGKTEDADYTYDLPAYKKHRVPVLGLYENYTNKVLVELLDQNGEVTEGRTLKVRAKKLPPDLRDIIEVKRMDPNPGYKNILITGGLGIKTNVIDQHGDIRFFLRRQVKGYGIFPTSRGRYIYMEKSYCNLTWTNPQCSVYHEMDFLGRSHKTFLSDNGVHHSVDEKEGGNLLIATNTRGTKHCEDAVGEIDYQTGEEIWALYFEDLFGGAYKDMTDWAHINSSAYYPETNEMICSLRNLHAIVSVDYTTKKLNWILSDPEFWKGTPVEDKVLKPIGDIKWFYQQHASYYMDENLDGNPDTRQLILFDNHWSKRRPAESFDDDLVKSYVTIFNINSKDMTVSMQKAFPCRKTKIRGNALYLHDRKRVYAMAGAYVSEHQGSVGGIYEFDYDTGKKVSEIQVKPGYFRAYGFEPEIAELCQPQDFKAPYLLGNLKKPVEARQEDLEGIRFSVKKELFKFCREYERKERCLFVPEYDHELKKMYFHGKKHDYIMDFTETEQVYGTYFGGSKHHLSIDIGNLPEDHYDIYIQYNGDFGYSGKYIEIGPKE
ncbi:MAG: aryl-sulfate sulfotransferase [Eubacterium sp.]|nr:aryl-sulfate sulfotransferase [Eubacterium sp.]